MTWLSRKSMLMIAPTARNGSLTLTPGIRPALCPVSAANTLYGAGIIIMTVVVDDPYPHKLNLTNLRGDLSRRVDLI